MPCRKQSIGFWVWESPGLCGLFSHVHVGHSLSCCFNPYVPALMQQWGPCPCPCVFVLESPPAPRALLQDFSHICIYTFSHKAIHTDKRWLLYTTVFMKKHRHISLTCFPMLQQSVTLWEIRPLRNQRLKFFGEVLHSALTNKPLQAAFYLTNIQVCRGVNVLRKTECWGREITFI